MKTSKAFAPAAISSFFEICDTQDNKSITELEKVGAIGGGFGLQKGVLTKVTAQEAQKNSINISINSKFAPEAKTTREVIETLLGGLRGKYDVWVEHRIEVPIGTGFGTSAGGALTAGLALKEALSLPLTYNQIGKIAHIAEIKCRTGLGTVSSLTFTGGCVLVVEPGAPGICQLDRIPISPDYVIVAGVFQSNILNKTILSAPEKKQVINRYGKKTLQAILDEPSLENFLERCWEFSEKSGFATQNVRQLVKLARKAGAVGAAQNMIGEAAHALVLEENACQVAEAFKKLLPSEQVIVSKIELQGARLIGHAEI
ncbi:MAG: pantoate kinase [Candidatus Bathyarchaeia archaeon]